MNLHWVHQLRVKFFIKLERFVRWAVFNNNGAIAKRHRLENFMLCFESPKHKEMFCYKNTKTGDYEITFNRKHFHKLPLEEKLIIDNVPNKEYATIWIPRDIAIPCEVLS